MDELKSLETTRLRRPAARGALGRSFPHLVYGERAAKAGGGGAGIRLPLGVLGMIALIGVVETAIALAAPGCAIQSVSRGFMPRKRGSTARRAARFFASATAWRRTVSSRRFSPRPRASQRTTSRRPPPPRR